jgi:hypothetical protein
VEAASTARLREAAAAKLGVAQLPAVACLACSMMNLLRNLC